MYPSWRECLPHKKLCGRAQEPFLVGELEAAEAIKGCSGVDPPRAHQKSGVLARTETSESVEAAAGQHPFDLVKGFTDGQFAIADMLEHASNDPSNGFGLAALNNLLNVGQAYVLIVKNYVVRSGGFRFGPIGLSVFGKGAAPGIGCGPGPS